MNGRPGSEGGSRQQLGLFVFLGGWVAAIVVLVLVMMALIPETDLEADLLVLEETDTEEATLDGPLPAVLQPLPEPVPEFSKAGSVYVPMYSGLYVGGQRSLTNLSATLSLRNTSADQSLVVTSIKYFNGRGESVADLLDAPRLMAPRTTAEVYIDQNKSNEDPVTGIVIGWGAGQSIAPPLVEAVIVGSYGIKSISFVSRGENRP